MTQISILNSFTAGTKIQSVPVNENFTTIKTAHNETDNRVDNIEADYIKKDGTVDFTGVQSYATDLSITDPLQLVHRGYVDDVTGAYSITSNMPTIANNVADANNDIDFTAGSCWDLTTNAKIVSTAKTKRLDANFAAGTNQGMLDTGSKAISKWYHLFAISKADGTEDFLASLSPTAPTMPNGYVNKRRVASIRTNSSGNIIGFFQKSDHFFYKSPIMDVDINTGAVITRVSYTLSIPLGIKIIPLITSTVVSTDTTYGIFTCPDSIDITPTDSIHDIWTGASAVVGYFNGFVLSDIQSKISYRSSYAGGQRLQIKTNGYIDSRGIN